MIISISGRISHGKDTVADIIRYLSSESYKTRTFDQFKEKSNNPDVFGTHYNSDWEVKKFAEKLKQVASMLTGIPRIKFEDQEFKKTFLGDEWNYVGPSIDGGKHGISTCDLVEKRMTVRELLQKLGTDAIREGLHDNTWVNALFSDYHDYDNWIISDTRFTNEIWAVKKHGGITLRVVRNIPKPDNEHISETELDDYQFDYIIKNDGTIEDLIEEVKKFMIHYKLL